MNHRTRHARHATITLVVVAGLGAPVLGPSSASAQMPDEIRVLGIVRDFRQSHADFDVTPDAGYGHYAGNLGLSLAGEEVPSFNGAGFFVGTQWRNKDGASIAPHMFLPGAILKLATAPTVSPNSTLDSYDSSAGPYGSGLISGPPLISIGNVTPPVVTPDIGPSIGDVFLNGAGTTTISADLHCDEFELRDGHEVSIVGDRIMVVDGDFTIRDAGTVFALTDGASLSVYVAGAILLADDASINTPGNHSALTIYNVGTSPIDLKDGAETTASIISPDAELVMENDANFYGTFAGTSLTATNKSGVHIAEFAETACGVEIHDEEGAAVSASSGGIADAASYAEWFTDVFGTNISQQHWITLLRNGDGVYEYMDDEFFPIDDALFGNEGLPHNYLFTYTVMATFTYDECSNQFFEFMGSDDIWVFIGDDMVIDLGGVLANEWQRVDLDRANLVDGETYTAQIFYAQRNQMSARFRIRTTVELETTTQVVATGGFD